VIERDAVHVERPEPLADLRALHERIDDCTARLVDRYQRDPAQLAEIVPRWPRAVPGGTVRDPLGRKVAPTGAQRRIRWLQASQSRQPTVPWVRGGAGGPVGIAVRHVGRATLFGAGALATTLAAEVVAAKRRRFLPSEPVLEISGVVGAEDGEPLVLVVLGDSSVAGVGADSVEDTLTYGVAKALSDRHRVVLHALGVSGSKLCNVVGEQLPQVAGLDPDIVLVCVGTNDVTHGTTFREARQQLRLLADGLATVAPGAVVVVSGLPPAETALAFRRPLRDLLGLRASAFTRIYRAELARFGITVFDIAREARKAFRGRKEMFSSDLFHPSSAGYAFLATIYGRAVREALDAARALLDETAAEELAG
jgi:lysophospholipase L1-like esterase